MHTSLRVSRHNTIGDSGPSRSGPLLIGTSKVTNRPTSCLEGVHEVEAAVVPSLPFPGPVSNSFLSSRPWVKKDERVSTGPRVVGVEVVRPRRPLTTRPLPYFHDISVGTLGDTTTSPCLLSSFSKSCLRLVSSEPRGTPLEGLDSGK